MNNNNAFFAGLAVALVCVLIFLAGILALYVFFCLTLFKTQSAVRPRNRLIAPGLVWLHLIHLAGFIPIVGVIFSIGASIWDLIMIHKLAGSLKAEFEARGWTAHGEGFGRPMGLFWSIGQLIVAPMALIVRFVGPQFGDPSIVLAASLVILGLSLAIFVIWIIYWVQMAGYGRRLREGRYRYAGSIEADYDDEYRGGDRWADDDDFDDDHDAPPRRRLPDDEFDDDPPRRRDDD